MAMAMQRPSLAGHRPAYMDNLFRDASTHSNSSSSLPPSAHSSMSSLSTASSYDLRSSYHSTGRPLTPAPEEESNDDAFSIRSKKSIFASKRFKFGSILNRRTYPQSPSLSRSASQTLRSRTPEPDAADTSLPTSKFVDRSLNRRPSLPHLDTSFPPPVAVSTYATRPLPAVPGAKDAPIAVPAPLRLPPKRPFQTGRSRSVGSKRPIEPAPLQDAQELSCQKCYYFTARNCNGYVMGGETGDACEGCLQLGFFGAK
ncbi:unnamed protein product [Zymoseptoria tritici ST99CH_1A5]|nr:unnamed protein product [Zymoseptoria tritici ST99CH_1E4]SMR54675.1 unnamed protein product [Zymoseptoria tritici ST99CH_3D1]SMY24822.1 unnamed protein product [Zymoseptoria tritici ST99CH_1A5]